MYAAWLLGVFIGDVRQAVLRDSDTYCEGIHFNKGARM